MDHPKINMPDAQVETIKKSGSNLDIRFEDIIAFFGKHLFSLIVFAFIAGVAGFGFSYSFPKTYQSNITMLPEYGGAKKSSLAMLAGGNNSEGAEKLLPDLYPVILASSPFGIYLLKQPVTDQYGHTYKSFELFLKRDSTQSSLTSLLPSSPTKTEKSVKLSDPNILLLSAPEAGNIRMAMGLISSSIDSKAGVITISAETEDPVVSAILVEASKNYLINYVEEYRTAKALQQVNLLKDQMASSNVRFRKAEYTLQSYRDRNRNAFLNVAQIEEQRLQSDYLLAQSLHEDLVRRYEQALNKVKEEKPVFKVLEPVTVPLAKSNPKRLRFFFISAFLGGVLCLAYILLFKKNISKPIIRSPFKSGLIVNS
ncbi:lipopolysaccharide biosynthesis protein [Dyadobacter sp. CY356]|uniref:lipopolysaccharide biosynthesis protein n=1 Tax=Dyadobacter sp. CY356 TaxID=2906442 RepID=UPI001F45CA57|nr:lipopolysaccharide biosynthesis protein [Dyadobacter sp. CY356]MCF0058305.1 lipopolysaccharide biosynthesis protein [Dyadobacter sp. CY356]